MSKDLLACCSGICWFSSWEAWILEEDQHFDCHVICPNYQSNHSNWFVLEAILFSAANEFMRLEHLKNKIKSFHKLARFSLFYFYNLSSPVYIFTCRIRRHNIFEFGQQKITFNMDSTNDLPKVSGLQKLCQSSSPRLDTSTTREEEL